MSCLSEVPTLLMETNVARRNSWGVDVATRYSFLDQAHTLRERLATGLLRSDLYSRNNVGALGSFDKLGLCLAALVALDRVIEDLRPVETRGGDTVEDKTGELCAQLLQLELGTADAYPWTGELVNLHAMFETSCVQRSRDDNVLTFGRCYVGISFLKFRQTRKFRDSSTWT